MENDGATSRAANFFLTFCRLAIVGFFQANFANVLLYSRSFSSFFVRCGVFFIFENQLVINYF